MSSAPIFTFAIITDTHIRPPAGDQSSPFPVNDLANGRARYAVAAIARHRPAFTVHLGDMVHPLPHLPTYSEAAEEALRIFEPLGEDVHYVPGNHDIGDKPMAGSPAGPVTEETAGLYEKFFGQDCFSFEHSGTRFVVINSSLAGTGNGLEKTQRQWLEQELAENADERLFLFSHYPPFINSADEPLHYDNYEQTSRAWLLDLVEEHNVEAVFCGHVHQFFYNRSGGVKLYCLPPTSFIRQDYSELYSVEPAPEFGRNDVGKFSYTLVDVYDQGHRLRLVPTQGRSLEAGEALAVKDPVAVRPSAAPLAVHLRHAWARAVDLPYNGPMEEFGRKRARDDYPLLRLWQMGITSVRTPLSDLVDPEYGPRIRDWAATGISFCLFHSGVPSAELWVECKNSASYIDAVEFVSGTGDMSDLAEGLAQFDPDGGPDVQIGKYHSSAHEAKSGSRFAHSVSPGFMWAERHALLASLKDNDRHSAVKGVSYQINLDDDLVAQLLEMNNWSRETGYRSHAIIRLATTNPAEPNFDDKVIDERIQLALRSVKNTPLVSLQLDVFSDVDRGYHPRYGLIDRRSNFRPAGLNLARR
ncbi:MAG: metallophosphoesterase [Pseudomonadota bacterium]